MAQIGNDDDKNAVPLRRSIYKNNDGGKGARPRINIYSKQYQDNWDRIFKKKGEKKNAKKKNND